MATKGKKSANLPAVPTGLGKPVRDFLISLKETVETMQGKRRNSRMNTVVTFADLANMGLKVSQKVGTDADYDFTRFLRSDNPPNPPRSLVVDQQIFAHRLTWTNPSDKDLSHVEIWCAVGSDSLSDAERIGIVTKPVVEFTHSGLNTRTSHYYWIRSFNWAGKYSTWEPKQGGYLVPASLDVARAESLHVLQDSITESQLYTNLNTRLNNIESNKAQIEVNETDISGVKAQYFIKTDVNGHIAGFGVANDGATSEAVFLVDKFAVVTPGQTPKVPFVIAPLNGVDTVGIDGNMVVDGSIAARTLDAEIITGAFLAASAQISLGLNGLLRMEEGAKLFAGAGNLLLNTDGNQTSLMIGQDGALDVNGNAAAGKDYMVLTNGDIQFYRWMANGHRMYKALKRWETGYADNGTWVNLPGYWVGPPQIQLSPRNLTCYKNSSPTDQALNMQVTAIEEYSDNQYRFKADARLIIAAGSQDYPVGYSASGSDSAGPTSNYATPANCTRVSARFKVSSVAPGATSVSYYYRTVSVSLLVNGAIVATTSVSIGATINEVSGIISSGAITAGSHNVALRAVSSTSGSTFNVGEVAYDYEDPSATKSYNLYVEEPVPLDIPVPVSPGADWVRYGDYDVSFTMIDKGLVRIGGNNPPYYTTSGSFTTDSLSSPTVRSAFLYQDGVTTWYGATLTSVTITAHYKKVQGSTGSSTTNLTFESATMDTGAVNELAAGTVNYIAIGE